MKKFALSILVFAAFCTAWAAPLFIGYYPDWGKWHKPAYTVDKVPYNKLTHVLWSFITPNTDGTLKGDAADDPSALDSMVTLAHAAGTKVIVSLGGGGQSETFVPVARDNTLRQKFVANLVQYVADHNLDGLDMDWEFDKVPVPEQDTTAYSKLLTELREALPKDKSLSAALCRSPRQKFGLARIHDLRHDRRLGRKSDVRFATLPTRRLHHMVMERNIRLLEQARRPRRKNGLRDSLLRFSIRRCKRSGQKLHQGKNKHNKLRTNCQEHRLGLSFR